MMNETKSNAIKPKIQNNFSQENKANNIKNKNVTKSEDNSEDSSFENWNNCRITLVLY